MCVTAQMPISSSGIWRIDAMKSLLVFVFSLCCSAITLAAERAAGIGWDFHPDSVTYATASTAMMVAIKAEGFFTAFNNGYYIWAHLLGMNVVALTAVNMAVYSVTNVFIYKFHVRYVARRAHGSNAWLILLLILILNPYRLHLSTTILKDSIIILLVVAMAVSNFKRSILILPVLALIRLASPLYLLMFVKKRMALALVVLASVATILFSSVVVDVLLAFNAAEMQLREFDKIPTFQEYGVAGVFLRSITWPLLAVSGLFAVLSPAAAFFPVALGSIFNQIYTYSTTRSLLFPAGAMLALMAFGAMVTGYTAYIRYVYPLMVVLPIVTLRMAIIANPTQSATYK